MPENGTCDQAGPAIHPVRACCTPELSGSCQLLSSNLCSFAEQILALAHVWTPDDVAWKHTKGKQWQNFRRELSEPLLQRSLPPLLSNERIFLIVCDLWNGETKAERMFTNVWSNIMQVRFPRQS